MPLSTISNGESGLSARNKINAGFAAIDALGAPGSSGTSGVSGSSGSSGTSGVNGAAGSSGSSGTSGINGTSGLSFTWLGAWNNLTSYSVRDVVEYNGSSYIAISSNNGAQPDSSPLDWSLMSQAGSSGTSGVSGTSGTSPAGGAPGLVAGPGTNSIQSNTTLTPGASASTACSIVLGVDASVLGNNAISIGRCARATNFGDPNGIAIGFNARYVGGNQIAIGTNAYNGAWDSGVGRISVVIGQGACATNYGGATIAIGPDAVTGNSYGVVIGRSACAIEQASENFSVISIGYGASAYRDSISIGNFTTANCSKTTIVGYSSVTCANYAVVVGANSTSSHENAVVLGYNKSSVVADHTHVASLYIASAPTYADNSAATTGGLVAGQVYKTSTGQLMIVY